MKCVENERLISASLDVLRFPLALIVVLVHVINIDDVGIYWDGNLIGNISEGSTASSLKYIINVFTRGISVPVYLFISGFVFFKGMDCYSAQIYRNKINNRIRSLLIPYVIWNAVELLMIIIINTTPLNNYTAGGHGGLNLNFKNILSCFWIYNGNLVASGVSAVQENVVFPLNTPLWFIRDLFCVALITPILYFILKKWKYWALLIMFILWLFPLPGMPPLLNQFVLVFFFFSLGAVLAIHKMDIINIFKRKYYLGWILYVGGALSFIAFGESSIGEIFKKLSVLGVLLVAYNIALKRVVSGNLRHSSFLSSSSMFIYLTHAIFCMRVYKIILLYVRPQGNMSVFLCLILTYVIIIITLLIIYYCISRYWPNFAVFLTGRRARQNMASKFNGRNS